MRRATNAAIVSPLAAEKMATVAKALAHPARLQILQMLAAQSECRGTEVFSELPLAQSTISEHLRILKEAGLLSVSPVGTSAMYCLRTEALSEFANEVSRLAVSAPACDAERTCS